MESIKKLRKQLGLTLDQVAERAGMVNEQVARAERAGTDPRGSTLARLAVAMRVPVCELFENTGHERRKKR